MHELISSSAMQAMERSVIAAGISEEMLLEIAGHALARIIDRQFPAGGTLVVFAGKGHNAGDAFVAARELHKTGKWKLDIRLVFSPEQFKPLTHSKWLELQSMGIGPAQSLGAAAYGGPVVVLDALLGIGAKGPLVGDIAAACEAINHWREFWRVPVVAVDLPSGLDQTGSVVADLTVTFGFPKAELVEDAATEFVGRIEVCELETIGGDYPSGGDFLVTDQWIRQHRLPARRFSTHKGRSGRVGIVAGSRGCVGAARLSAEAAVRAGGGLVTLFVPEEIYSIAAAALTPEVMVRTIQEAPHFAADAWGIGPGIGPNVPPVVEQMIKELTTPTVLDADALNWISQTGLCGLESLPGKRLLTPHPGEMRRLLAQWRPELSEVSRADQAREFARVFGVTLLLKGSRSVMAERDRPLAYNSTGHPSMASGGMGDILTGVCAALMAQGLQPYEAGAIGSWVLGRAGELVAPHGYGASLVLDRLFEAMESVNVA